MHIHLTDVSNRIEYVDLLLEFKYRSGLLSYHYEKKCSRFYTNWWNGLIEINCKPITLIDSGAFTAFTTGKIINVKDYGDWALKFQSNWQNKMSTLRFFNLDVIGDQDASWDNQTILENMGLHPIPIITYGTNLDHLRNAIANYNYVALGGLVPYASHKNKLISWLNKCFAIIVAQYKKTGNMPKIHLLGITSDWVLKKYPCYSSDSSSWTACLRYGKGKVAGIKQLPRVKNKGYKTANQHTLRHEIKKYQTMEQEATKLWGKRGIIFND